MGGVFGQFALGLLEGGDLVRENGGYVLRRPAEQVEVPTTVQAVVLARIDRLTNELKDVLQAAAVVGRVFSYPVLHRVLEQTTDLDDALAQLQDLDFIYLTSLSPHREYSFKHVLTQQAVYDTLLRVRREALHERAGHAIEDLWVDRLEEVCELLAHHYARSRNADRAVEYLERANRKAIRMNAPLEAKGFFVDAMRFLDALPSTRANHERRVALISNQHVPFLLLFQQTEYYGYLTRFEKLARDLRDPSALGVYHASMGSCEWALGEFDQAIRRGQRAVELCEAAGNFGALIQAYAVLLWSYVAISDYEAALRLEVDFDRASAKGTNDRFRLWGLGAMSLACTLLGRFDRALDLAGRMFRLAEDLGDRSIMSFASWQIAWAFVSRGHIPQALDMAAQGARMAPTPADQSWAEAVLAIAHCRAGNATQAIEILGRLVPAFRAARFLIAEFWTAYLGEAYWRAGNIPMAVQTLEEVIAIAEPRGMRLPIGAAHRLLGEIRSIQDPAQATIHLDRSLELLTEIKAEPELALAYVAYGRLHKRLGRLAEARDYFSRALEIFERLGMMLEPDRLRAELAELPTT